MISNFLVEVHLEDVIEISWWLELNLFLTKLVYKNQKIQWKNYDDSTFWIKNKKI